MVTKDMGIMEVVQEYPQLIEVFRRFDMGCVGCLAANYESIEQGANAHEVNIDALMIALNAAL
ncbi:MAG: DUF1858 domain-containing protein [Anaerofustis stercorihominis]|nr:DUF1858 domain-containing protein [Anaerofustis stercorihominis]